MEKDWILPPIETFTGSWSVDPQLSDRYARYGRHGSAFMHAAALGLLYETFRPSTDAERSRYYRIAKDPDYNVQMRVFRDAGALPETFRRRLRRELVAEVRRLIAWLRRMEADSYPVHELSAFEHARLIVRYALMPLQVDGMRNRVTCAILKLEEEINMRLPTP